jgi:hypothetical protein
MPRKGQKLKHRKTAWPKAQGNARPRDTSLVVARELVVAQIHLAFQPQPHAPRKRADFHGQRRVQNRRRHDRPVFPEDVEQTQVMLARPALN